MDSTQVKNIIEAALLAAGQPLDISALAALFEGDTDPPIDNATVADALASLAEDCAGRGIELTEVASGFRYQVRASVHDRVSRLWAERPARYSRALLETLALIAYRQPVTRGEIEQVRGVAVSSNIIRTLEEREWIRTVGHRETPGHPALYGTTRAFLDYFNLKSLDDLPPLADIIEMDAAEADSEFVQPPGDVVPTEASGPTIQIPASTAAGSDAAATTPSTDLDEFRKENRA